MYCSHAYTCLEAEVMCGIILYVYCSHAYTCLEGEISCSKVCVE